MAALACGNSSRQTGQSPGLGGLHPRCGRLEQLGDRALRRGPVGGGQRGQPAAAGLSCLRRAGGILRELIVDGTREGLDAARGRGVRLGRPPAMTAEQIHHARDLLTRPDNTVSSIARLLGVSRATIYKHVPEVTTGRVAATLPPGGE